MSKVQTHQSPQDLCFQCPSDILVELRHYLGMQRLFHVAPIVVCLLGEPPEVNLEVGQGQEHSLNSGQPEKEVEGSLESHFVAALACAQKMC